MGPEAFWVHVGPTVELLLYVSDLQGFQPQVLPGQKRQPYLPSRHIVHFGIY